MKTCQQCNSKFKAKRSDARFCSTKCRMSHKRQATNKPKKSKLRKCSNCQTITKNAKFCSRPCQSDYTEKINRDKAIAVFYRTGFGKWLVYNMRRAKTVEILKGHDQRTLEALFQLYKTMVHSNGFGDYRERRFELGHLAPVAGNDSVGLLNTSNLMLVQKTTNRRLSNKEFGHLDSLECWRLKPELKVNASDKVSDILATTNNYLKGQLFSWIKDKKLRSATTNTTTNHKARPYSLTDVLYRELPRLAKHSSDAYFSFQVDYVATTLGIYLLEDDEDYYGVTPALATDIEVAVLTNNLDNFSLTTT